jgi:hypothetical protein
MFALYKISTNTVLQQWNEPPTEIIIKEENLMVTAPNTSWSYGDYQLIPMVYLENPKHFLSISDGTSEVISFDPTQLTVTLKYKDPPLDTVKTTLINMVSNNVNNNIASLNLDYASVLEVHELKADPSPDMLNYPLLTPLITKTIGNTYISSLADAAAYTMKQFKDAKKLLAQHKGFRDTKIAAINAANSVADAIAAHGNLSSSRVNPRGRATINK